MKKTRDDKTKSGLSKEFYSDLFTSGMFSDVTITIKGGHTYKGHKAILMSKSKRFARDLAVIKNEVTYVEDYDAHVFQSMLRFCYTGGYDYGHMKAGHTQKEQTRIKLDYHISVCQAGIDFEVAGIEEYSTKEFKYWSETMRNNEDTEGFVTAISKVNDMLGLDFQNALRKAAANEIQLFLKNVPDNTSIGNIRAMLSKYPEVAAGSLFYFDREGKLSSLQE